MTTLNKPNELLSTGYLSQLVQVAPGRLTERLDALGVQPTLIINGVRHYGAEVVEALQEVKERSK